mgnify:CR=1 FL=1
MGLFYFRQCDKIFTIFSGDIKFCFFTGNNYLEGSISLNGNVTVRKFTYDFQEHFCDDIRALSGKPLTDEQIDTAWIAMLGDVPENKLRLLLELRERYNTMLLSNTNELHWKWSEDTYFSYQGLCAQDFFHKIYLSYELHMLKPNADIFEYVLKDSNLLAEETMLIDDASVNCRAAELLGMKSYTPQPREDWSHLFK